MDQQITALRTDLANQAAAKREALGLELGAAWEDMEEAIEEKVQAFNHAVEQKLVWINKVRYYGLRHKLLEAVKELQAVFTDDVAGLRQMFADAAEERRLAADAAITSTQDEFEVFVAQVVATCDANRADQSTKLEYAIEARRSAFDELLGECRKAISWAIDSQIKALKDFLSNQYGYQGHKPGPYEPKPDAQYFDDEYVEAVQQYIDGVTKPLADQASAALSWLGQRKDALKDAVSHIEDEIENAQNARIDYELGEFASLVDGVIQNNGQLAAQLLADVQAKNDKIQSTLEALNHQYYGYQDVHGYRYKLLSQLHHQKTAFEQAVESSWVTWTQSRDLAMDTSAANAAAAAEGYESFLSTKLGEWEGASAAARADLQ